MGNRRLGPQAFISWPPDRGVIIHRDGDSRRTLSAIDEISRKPSSASRHDLEGVDRLRGTRHKKARCYLEVVRQRHSATIAANKLSVAKRTGKFSTRSDDAARQQVAANRERTVSSGTDLFSTTQLLLDMGTRQNSRSFMRITMIPNHAPEVMVRISVAELI